MTKEKEKIFVIINSYLVGDMLLVNSLVQNIKRLYQNSKVIMLTNKTFYDLSKYQKDVDDVIIWDRHGEHKGILGMFKFIKNFPYKITSTITKKANKIAQNKDFYYNFYNKRIFYENYKT